MCISVLLACMSAYHMVLGTSGDQKSALDPVTGLHMAVSYMSVLQTGLRSSGRAAPAPSCWATSPALQSSKIRFTIFFYKVHLFAYEEECVHICSFRSLFLSFSSLCQHLLLFLSFSPETGPQYVVKAGLDLRDSWIAGVCHHVERRCFSYSYTQIEDFWVVSCSSFGSRWLVTLMCVIVLRVSFKQRWLRTMLAFMGDCVYQKIWLWCHFLGIAESSICTT